MGSRLRGNDGNRSNPSCPYTIITHSLWEDKEHGILFTVIPHFGNSPLHGIRSTAMPSEKVFRRHGR